MCVYIYMYIHIYIYRERERERESLVSRRMARLLMSFTGFHRIWKLRKSLNRYSRRRL